MRSRRSIAYLAAGALALALLPQAGSAGPAPAAVGVVDFYAPTPVEPFTGVIPERFAADDLAQMLARTGQGLEVTPRAAMERAEAAAHWQEADVLRFARLTDLGHAVGAGRLVVGWIRLLAVQGGGHSGPPTDERGAEMPTAQTVLVLQVFDVEQGRITAEMRQEAFAVGVVRPLLVEQVLHRALAAALPRLRSTLTPQAP